jgi:hypothetical protein
VGLAHLKGLRPQPAEVVAFVSSGRYRT